MRRTSASANADVQLLLSDHEYKGHYWKMPIG